MKLVMSMTAALLASVLPGAAQAESYPTKPIRLIVPFAVGGLNDVLARVLAPKISEALGQSVIVENRGGAGSNIGTEYVARAEPDGYTLLLSSAALAINPGLYAKLSYDVQRDFIPIIQISKTQMVVMTAKNLPINTVEDLFEFSRTHPGKLNFGSSGTGAPSHLASELFVRTFKLDAVHVPYKGAGPALIALSAGEVQMMVDVLPTALPLHNSGRVKIIAVVSDKRIPALPQIPTLAEAGLKGYDAGSWNGILAPAGTPAPIIEKLSSVFRKIMESDEMRQKFSQLSVEPKATTPEQFKQFIQAETVKWGEVIKAASIRAE